MLGGPGEAWHSFLELNQAIRTLLISSAAKSGDLRLAFGLCSIQTQAVVGCIFLKLCTQEGAARAPHGLVCQQPALPPVLPTGLTTDVQGLLSPSLLPHLLLFCYFSEPRNTGISHGNQPRFPGTRWRHMALLSLCCLTQEPRLQHQMQSLMTHPSSLDGHLWIIR